MFSFTEAEIGQVDLFFRGRLASVLRSPGGLWFQHDMSHRHNPNPGGAGGSSADSGIAGTPPPGSSPTPVPAGTAVPGSDQPHPEPDAQKAGELAKAIDFLARMIFDRRITPTQPLQDYGLDNPQIVVIFYPRNPDNSAGPIPLTSFYVGSTLSHNLSYYAQISGDRDVALIPLYQVNMLTELTLGEVAQASFGNLAPNPTNR